MGGSNCIAALDLYKMETLILNLELLFNVHIPKVEKLNSFPLFTYHVCVWGGENMYAHGCTWVCIYKPEVDMVSSSVGYSGRLSCSGNSLFLAAKSWDDGQVATPTWLLPCFQRSECWTSFLWGEHFMHKPSPHPSLTVSTHKMLQKLSSPCFSHQLLLPPELQPAELPHTHLSSACAWPPPLS